MSCLTAPGPAKLLVLGEGKSSGDIMAKLGASGSDSLVEWSELQI
jgi:hypothetical protein